MPVSTKPLLEASLLQPQGCLNCRAVGHLLGQSEIGRSGLPLLLDFLTEGVRNILRLAPVGGETFVQTHLRRVLHYYLCNERCSGHCGNLSERKVAG